MFGHAINELAELTALAAESTTEITWLTKHRYCHSELDLKYLHTYNWRTFVLVSAEKNFVNATIVTVGILISSHALKSLKCLGKTLREGDCPRGVMVKALDCGIVVNEFELQSRYYVYFLTNILAKGMNPLYSQLWVK